MVCLATVIFLFTEDKNKSSSATQDELVTMVKERDQAIEDFQNVEAAFADLHRRYEKSKNTLEGFKKVKSIRHYTLAFILSPLH